MHGPKVQSMPVPATSRAVTRAAARTTSGLRVQPRPMWWGKIVDPLRPPWPWTASTPYTIGIPSRVASAWLW